MKTDPNKGCSNQEERLFWAVLHDAVAHPLMSLFGYPKWALRFHDYTSHRAWPRKAKPMNPHITYWRHGLWECVGDGLHSFGATPLMAYDNWLIFQLSMNRH